MNECVRRLPGARGCGPGSPNGSQTYATGWAPNLAWASPVAGPSDRWHVGYGFPPTFGIADFHTHDRANPHAKPHAAPHPHTNPDLNPTPA